MPAPNLTAYEEQYQYSVHGSQYNTFEQTCDTAAQLRGLVGLPGQQVFIRGLVVSGDGGAGPFWWSAALTLADDGQNVLVPSSPFQQPGAWIRLLISGANGAVFNTVSALTSFPIAPSGIIFSGTLGATATVQGYNTPGDNGGGVFDLLATSYTVDNVFVFACQGQAGFQWVRRFAASKICPEMAGCYGDTNPYTAHSGHDDTAAFQALINAMSPATTGYLFPQRAGGVISLTAGKWYLIDSANLVLANNISIHGTNRALVQWFNGQPSYTDGGIALNPTYTIAPTFFNELYALTIWNSGLPELPANTADIHTKVNQWFSSNSKAISEVSQASRLKVSYCRAYGFGYFIYTNMTQFDVDNLIGDCASGIFTGSTRETSLGRRIIFKSFWNGNIGKDSIIHVDLVAAGTGYSVNDVLTFTGGAGTLGTITVNTLGGSGAIATFTLTTAGEYTTFPTPQDLPVSVTGGTGSGATFNIYPIDAAYRPGTGIELNATLKTLANQGFSLFHTHMGMFQTAYKVSGAYNVTFMDLQIENGDNWGHNVWDSNGPMRGIWIQKAAMGNADPTIAIYQPYVSNGDVLIQIDGGSSCRIYGANLVTNWSATKAVPQTFVVGTAGSRCMMTATAVGGNTPKNPTPLVVLEAGALDWRLHDTSIGQTAPAYWLSVDASVLPYLTVSWTTSNGLSNHYGNGEFDHSVFPRWASADGSLTQYNGQPAAPLNAHSTTAIPGTSGTNAALASYYVGGAGFQPTPIGGLSYSYGTASTQSPALVTKTGAWTVSAIASMTSAGTGYAVNDTLTINGQIIITVNTIGTAGAIATYTLTFGGFFPVNPGPTFVQTGTSGTGSGATFTYTIGLVSLYITTAVVVTAGGTGYVVGDTLYDTVGGQCVVATVSSGVVATVKNILPGAAVSAPGSAVATTTTGAGTGCTLTLTMKLCNSVFANSNGNVMLGGLAIKTTTDTDNFPQMPYSKGAPTGTPATIAVGHCPFQYDTTNNKLWVWNKEGAAWKGVVLS